MNTNVDFFVANKIKVTKSVKAPLKQILRQSEVFRN